MKNLKKVAFVSVMVLGLSSCYVNTFNIGQGAQKGIKVSQKNHYLIAGLAPISVANPQEMAGDAKDYTVEIKHSFIDGLLNGITFGIYTPTTTTVTK